MEQAIAWIFRVKPVLFGLGFLAPVLAAALRAGGVHAVAGVAVLPLSLLCGGLWGGLAALRGKWF